MRSIFLIILYYYNILVPTKIIEILIFFFIQQFRKIKNVYNKKIILGIDTKKKWKFRSNT